MDLLDVRPRCKPQIRLLGRSDIHIYVKISLRRLSGKISENKYDLSFGIDYRSGHLWIKLTHTHTHNKSRCEKLSHCNVGCNLKIMLHLNPLL